MAQEETYTLDALEELRKNVFSELDDAQDAQSLEAFRIKYLGKKGILRNLLKGLKNLPVDQRKEFGAQANKLRSEVEERFSAKTEKKEAGAQKSATAFDSTLPGYPFPQGSIHPLTRIRNQIRDIFITMGFDVAYGPDVESDYYNFAALNFPPYHPARDMQDTFTVSPEVVLRTHTSPVQIRVMEKQKPPLRYIMPGRVYRHEEISSRSYCIFHQIEGLYVDRNVSFSDLKGTLLGFARRFFDDKTQIKIRPSFFPFTEPSVEIDVECFLCKGAGCPVCKQSGWLEILGAGMVHPNVLASGGIDSDIYTGFAFGMGLERIALLKYTIDDIRLFFENDIRFLKQF
ncbi:MAG: phenylalanine--tRNA ligase subunit alpha [Chitinivibrionales bacterium]|nr:phenylalanine--tRNA ligase subunit alpha [Chitinivibrionales bacterium]